MNPLRAAAQQGQHGPRDVDEAEDIRLELLPDLVVGRLLDAAEERVPGVVDEHIDTAEGASRLVDG